MAAEKELAVEVALINKEVSQSPLGVEGLVSQCPHLGSHKSSERGSGGQGRGGD